MISLTVIRKVEETISFVCVYDVFIMINGNKMSRCPKKYEAESQFPEYKEKTRKHGKRKMEKFQRRPQKK